MSEFDWAILQRPTAMALVRGQLGFSRMVLESALEGLEDDEWLWEPAPGAWSLRPRADVQTTADHVVGAGDLVLEWPPDDGTDNRTRTIAWLLAHLTETFFERYEHAFGGHTLRRDDVVFADTAAGAVRALVEQLAAWSDAIAALPEEEVFTVGLASATEIERQAPFGHLVLHLNRELVSHGAEISVLRDLYAARS